MSLSPLLAPYANVILDLDGTVWVGDRATPRAAEAIAAIRASGRGLCFVTNDGTHAPEEYVGRLQSLGVDAAAAEIVSVGVAIEHHLAGGPPGRGAYVIGAPAIHRHVAQAGLRILNHRAAPERADVVVLAAHEGFDYGELSVALSAAVSGAELISGGRDRSFPTPTGIAPGTGAIVAALEYACDRSVHSVGKPDPEVFGVALERLGPGATLVIGDHLISDLAGAANAGLDAAIVLSGVSTAAAAASARDPTPVAIGADLGLLVLTPECSG